MIRTKCILKPKELKDGLRVSVMSRHTLNDGVTKDTRIKPGTFDSWMKIFSPPAKLVGDYYKRGLPFEEFEKRYLEYLRLPEVSKIVKRFAKLALEQDLTLMCIEESPENCHRRLLAEEMQKYEPNLKVKHK